MKRICGEPWRYHDFPVNQLFGIQSELPNLMTVIPFTAYSEVWALYAERLAWESGSTTYIREVQQ